MNNSLSVSLSGRLIRRVFYELVTWRGVCINMQILQLTLLPFNDCSVISVWMHNQTEGTTAGGRTLYSRGSGTLVIPSVMFISGTGRLKGSLSSLRKRRRKSKSDR